MYSAFAESVGFAPQRIHDTQLEATNIKSSAYSWRNLSLRSHWNIFSFADVDTLKFKVIFPRRKVEACDMSLAGRDDYVFCCKHEQCGTRLKVWQSNEFGVKGVTCLYSVSPQNSSVASGQKKVRKCYSLALFFRMWNFRLSPFRQRTSNFLKPACPFLHLFRGAHIKLWCNKQQTAEKVADSDDEYSV